MKLLLDHQKERLLANSAIAEAGEDTSELQPVVKFFNPCGAATWLISEMDEEGRMFGLCDLGMGSPEMGYVMLDEIKSVRLPFGLKIERDMHFVPRKSLSHYADEARAAGSIAA